MVTPRPQDLPQSLNVVSSSQQFAPEKAVPVKKKKKKKEKKKKKKKKDVHLRFRLFVQAVRVSQVVHRVLRLVHRVQERRKLLRERRKSPLLMISRFRLAVPVHRVRLSLSQRFRMKKAVQRFR